MDDPKVKFLLKSKNFLKSNFLKSKIYCSTNYQGNSLNYRPWLVLHSMARTNLKKSKYFSTSTTGFTIIGHSFIDCIEFLADFSKQNGLKYEVVRKKSNI